MRRRVAYPPSAGRPAARPGARGARAALVGFAVLPVLWAVLWAAACGRPLAAPAPGPAPPPAPSAGVEPPRRTFLILLDAIPFDLLARLTDPARGEEALFRGFHPPVPVVSTFPSTTSVATVGLFGRLGLERSPGYEARFFDWSQMRVRGGGPVSFFRIDFPWREFFDWSRKGVVRSTVSGARPVRSSVHRVRRAVRAFAAGDDPLFTAYVETTDTAAHLKGPDELEPIFRALDAALVDARAGGEPFRAVILSDHGLSGGEPLVNVWKPLRHRLEEAGFVFRKRLREPRDLALTPYGLVSSFELYVLPESRAAAAAAAAATPGVDLCAYPEPGAAGGDAAAWTVTSADGLARIERRGPPDSPTWSYRPESDDPLDFAPLAAQIAAAAGTAAAGFHPDAAWREATLEHHYPDALHRIAAAFELVENPAAVVCSCEPGFMYGLKFTEWGAKVASGGLRWTHGALHRAATNGFLLTDDPEWRPRGPLRFDLALAPLVGPVGRP